MRDSRLPTGVAANAPAGPKDCPPPAANPMEGDRHPAGTPSGSKRRLRPLAEMPPDFSDAGKYGASFPEARHKDRAMTRTVDHTPSALISPPRGTNACRADPRLEPAFLTAWRGRLRIEANGWVDKAKAYYAHAVARTPTALRLHVQRITLYTQTADSSVIGALLDLFLVLGDKGLPLRSRMLALARPLISSRDYHTLHRQLEHGDVDTAFLQQRSAGSVLSRGIAGDTRLIERTASTGEWPEDPLKSARQQLEYGQTELAQTTLEQALLTDCRRLDLHLALLEIYRHARDRQAAAGMWQRLRGRDNPARTEWQRLLTQLDEEQRTT